MLEIESIIFALERQPGNTLTDPPLGFSKMHKCLLRNCNDIYICHILKVFLFIEIMLKNIKKNKIYRFLFYITVSMHFYFLHRCYYKIKDYYICGQADEREMGSKPTPLFMRFQKRNSQKLMSLWNWKLLRKLSSKQISNK